MVDQRQVNLVLPDPTLAPLMANSGPPPPPPPGGGAVGAARAKKQIGKQAPKPKQQLALRDKKPEEAAAAAVAVPAIMDAAPAAAPKAAPAPKVPTYDMSSRGRSRSVEQSRAAQPARPRAKAKALDHLDLLREVTIA